MHAINLYFFPVRSHHLVFMLCVGDQEREGDVHKEMTRKEESVHDVQSESGCSLAEDGFLLSGCRLLF